MKNLARLGISWWVLRRHYGWVADMQERSG